MRSSLTGRNNVHVSESFLSQRWGFLPQKVRSQTRRGAVGGDGEEGGAAG